MGKCFLVVFYWSEIVFWWLKKFKKLCWIFWIFFKIVCKICLWYNDFFFEKVCFVIMFCVGDYDEIFGDVCWGELGGLLFIKMEILYLVNI